MQHFEGAATLIKQRNGKPTASELFKGLLIGVRSAIVRISERYQLQPANTSQVSRAIATSTFIDVNSELWQDAPESLLHNPATLLDRMYVDVANLLATVDRTPADIIDCTPGEPHRATRSSDLAHRAELVDARLATWPDLLSPNWNPVQVLASAIPWDVVNAGLYGDSCDVYSDIIICGTWNDWRHVRLKVLALIARLGNNDSKARAILSIQQLADDICASIPFSLGSRVKPSTIYAADSTYPSVDGQRVPEAHQQRAAAAGGWLLFSPLKEVWHVGMYLRKGQLDWVSGQLLRLATIYNIRPILDKFPVHRRCQDL